MLSLVVVASLGIFAAPALAAKTHHLIKVITTGASGQELGSQYGLGVDEHSGNVFISNLRNKGLFADVVGPEGEEPGGLASPFSVAISAGHEGEQAGVAVDNSSISPSKGDLYVADTENHAVKKFVLNPLSEEYELNESLSVSKPVNVAVDTKGNVFIADVASKSIVKFNPAGVEVGKIQVGFFTRAVAVDASGDLYAQEAFQGEGSPARVVKFVAGASGEIEPGTQPIEIAGGISPNTRPTAITVDQSTEELYVAFRNHVEQYDSAGERVGEFETDAFTRLDVVAVNAQTGKVYVFGAYGSVSIGTRPGVGIFGPTVVAPDATTEEVGDLTPTTAILTGTVSAAGGVPATCEFEYTSEASFNAKGFEGAITAPCSPAGPFIGTGIEPVTAAIGGLTTQTIYQYRLVASSADGTTRGKALHFFTPGPPSIAGESVSGLTTTKATLEALVNPSANLTSYVFEYVSEADFNQSGYAKATIVPLGGKGIGAGFEDIEVAEQISGLTPSTNYFFRASATNSLGTTHGPGQFFTALGLNGFELADGRVFEQATPVDKGGASPEGYTDFVKAASGGGGITFFSAGGIPGGEGAQQFPQYIAARAPNGSGWSSQGVLPPASNGSSALVRSFSDDLAQTYVTQSDRPNEPGTFYERDNATHTLRAISSGIDTIEHHNSYVGSSIDGSKALIELLYGPIAPSGAAAGSPNTFVWDRATGTLHLTGVLNDEQAPAKGTSAGSYDFGGPLNYTSYEHPISNDGSHVFFTAMGNHEIYLRKNPTRPQSPMEGNKCTDPELACTIQVSASKRTVAPLKDEKAATLWTVTPDGSEAFFTSPGKLTNNAKTGPKNEGNDLYRYDAYSDQLTDLTAAAKDPNGADVQGVIGASDDGSYVYFVANGVLAPGAKLGDCEREAPGTSGYNDDYLEFTSGDCNLYLWHDGTIAFISAQPAGTDVYNWVRKPNTDFEQRSARVTSDGRTLLFRSTEKLTSYDNEGVDELYRYSAEDGELSCVTCNPSGAAPLGPATLQSFKVVIVNQYRPAPVQTRNLSADGSRVFFESPDKLVASDTNGDDGCPKAGSPQTALSCQDVYEWEAKGTGSCHSEAQNGGCLYLLSTGTGSDPSYFADASLSGNDAFIFTSQPLVRQDQDELVDIYDARVGGGIAAQNEPPPPICEGEACRGTAATLPTPQSPGSASFAAAGNPKPVRHKRKGRHHKKKHHHKKQAKHQGRSAPR